MSPEPGTTRDYIEEFVQVGSHGLLLVDTAGLNPAPGAVEGLGIGRTLERAGEADLFLWVVDGTLPVPPLPPGLERVSPANTVLVLNKADLVHDRANLGRVTGAPGPHGGPAQGFARVSISATLGQGLAELRLALETLADNIQVFIGDSLITVNHRHVHALGETRMGLVSALETLRSQGPGELIASDLRAALDGLGAIAGRIDNEEILDRLFSTFCIGK